MFDMRTLFAILLATLATPAHAQNKKDWDACVLGRDMEQSDAACVRVINDRATPTRRRAVAHDTRSVHFNIKGDYKGMETALTEAMKLDPKDAGYPASRCYARMKLVRYADALVDCNKAVSLDPTSTHALKNRAIVYEMQRNPLAVSDRQEVVRLNSNYESWKPLCNAQTIVMEFQDAYDSCNESLLLKKDEPVTLYLRGFVHLNLDDPDHAIEDFNVAMTAPHLKAGALYGRSIAKRMNKDTKGADADVAEARTLAKDIEFDTSLYWTPK